jgi:hypothetical protein
MVTNTSAGSAASTSFSWRKEQYMHSKHYYLSTRLHSITPSDGHKLLDVLLWRNLLLLLFYPEDGSMTLFRNVRRSPMTSFLVHCDGSLTSDVRVTRPGFDPLSVRVGFIVNKWELEQVLSDTSVSPAHSHSMFIIRRRYSGAASGMSTNCAQPDPTPINKFLVDPHYALLRAQGGSVCWG